MYALGTVILVCGLLAAASGKDYAGAKLLEVEKSPILQEIVRTQHLDVWGSNLTHSDVLVTAEELPSFTRKLRSFRLPFSVGIDDVQQAIQDSSPQVDGGRQRSRGSRSRMDWNNYQRLSTIHEFLDDLARSNPNLVSTGIMGQSIEGRPLKYVKISSGNPNAKAVFIDGGIHAREWVSPASVTWIIKELVENWNRLPQNLRQLDYYILPVINPDGYEYTHTRNRMWRKNRRILNRRDPDSECNGIDLNRNFDHNWAGLGTSKDACDETYVGTGPLSEPESRAVADFLTGLKDRLVVYLSFHSYSQMILIPYAYNYNKKSENFREQLEAGRRAAAAIKSIAGETYDVGNTVDLLDVGAGGSDDWTKGALKVRYAYCIELRDTGRYRFLLPARFIIPTAREAFEAVKAIAGSV